MAVSIVTTPNTPISAYQPIVFKLSISDIGDGIATIKKICYIVYVNGVAITPLESIRPNVAGGVLSIDISKDVQPYVSTIIPGIITGGVAYNNSSMIADVKIQIGEIVVDLENCESTTTMGSESSVLKVFNTALQVFEPELHTTANQFLTHQPSVTWQSRGAANYIGTKGQFSGTITTSEGDNVNAPSSYDAALITLSPLGLSMTNEATMKWLQYEGNGKKFRVYFRDTCSKGSNFCNIMFLDPLGGRNCMSFEDVSNMGISSSHDTFDRVYPYSYPNPGGLIGRPYQSGRTIMNKESRQTFKLLRTGKDDEEHRKWFTAFLSSVGYHMQVPLPDGTPTWQKFILDSGSIDFADSDGELDFTVTGYLVPLVNTQKMDK